LSPSREFDPDTEVDVTRLTVLGILSRGMSFAYAARTATVTIGQVREIAEAAGHPDIDAVKGEYQALRAGNAKPAPKRVAPPPRTAAERPKAVPDVVIGAKAPTVSRAEQEYRGAVVQAGPTPEHREPLEDYVARRLEEQYTAGLAKAEDELLGDLQSFRPMGIIPGLAATPLPPATDNPVPARRPRQMPCEVCGHGVLTSYVDANGGRPRHGHHPDNA
jgi:hypothetical protein